MTRVYVDLGLLMADPSASGATDADAARALDFLRDAGHEVVLVAEPPTVRDPTVRGTAVRDPTVRGVPRGSRAAVVANVPLRPESPAWYLASDAEHCRGRSARLRTVLVGAPRVTASIHRCDTTARDVRAAALEILASEAMPSGSA